MAQKYNLQVDSDIYNLAKLQGWFQQFQDHLPKLTWMQCNLALVEVFTNVVSYAHESLPVNTPIDIEVLIDSAKSIIEMRIWDYGKPFDWQSEIIKATERINQNLNLENIDDVPTGGRGLYITQKVADTINYEVGKDGHNCFVMIKHFAKLG
ncbi:MAG: ATP-binding protein [Pseudanabaenaceae cyanobacterium bins.39]|nr:ATP-binding protein [Pseudanabaenaceae cyanobacterium bins.39]